MASLGHSHQSETVNYQLNNPFILIFISKRHGRPKYGHLSPLLRCAWDSGDLQPDSF